MAEADGADRGAAPGTGLGLVLASASPRRLELLRLAGLAPAVRPAGVDERRRPAEPPLGYVARLARAKADAVGRAPAEVVLAADTAVVLDGEPIGKPSDAEHAATLLRRLSGRAHTVATGVAVLGPAGPEAATVTTEVVVADLTDAQIARYVATGEPLGKAGGYAIQGGAAVLVERVCGSWTNVVGLPVVETLGLLRRAGVRV